MIVNINPGYNFIGAVGIQHKAGICDVGDFYDIGNDEGGICDEDDFYDIGSNEGGICDVGDFYAIGNYYLL